MYRNMFSVVRKILGSDISPINKFGFKGTSPQSMLNVLGTTQIRNYKSEFNIEWVPPPKLKCTDPSKTGDHETLPEVDLKRATLHAANVEELKGFSPEVQRLMSLEMSPRSKQFQVIKSDMIKNVQKHSLDHSSMEATIAALTARIRNGQKFMDNHKNDVFFKHYLKEAVEKRRKFLKQLRRMDYKRFEWILEKLNLVYHPVPNPDLRITKNDSLQRLTTYYCNSIREKRLEAYREELKERKAAFSEEKKALLQWIEKEEKELGIRQ